MEYNVTIMECIKPCNIRRLCATRRVSLRDVLYRVLLGMDNSLAALMEGGASEAF